MRPIMRHAPVHQRPFGQRVKRAVDLRVGL